MGFHLEKDEEVGSGVQRILTEQTKRLSEDLSLANVDSKKAIHEVRKRCKRVRAVLRLVRPSAKDLHRRENTNFRDMARRLSPFRDADVRLAAFDELVDGEGELKRFAPLRNLLADGDASESLEKQIAQTAKEADAAKERLEETDFPDGATFNLLGPGLHGIYKQGRKAMSKAYDESEAASFHEWRKRVKDLGYQVQILRDSWPGVLKRLHKELDKLGDLLGKDHDLAVLRKAVLKRAEGVGEDEVRAFLDLVEDDQLRLHAEAWAIGKRVYAEKPEDFVRRLETYWETWKREAPA